LLEASIQLAASLLEAMRHEETADYLAELAYRSWPRPLTERCCDACVSLPPAHDADDRQLAGTERRARDGLSTVPSAIPSPHRGAGIVDRPRPDEQLAADVLVSRLGIRIGGKESRSRASYG
jgi:hypothetical protein